jgi:hypothetical protein
VAPASAIQFGNGLTVTDLGGGVIRVDGGGGPLAADTLWDAKGDLVAGIGADSASRLGVGANGQVLVADSGQAAGIKWASPVFLGYAEKVTNSTGLGATEAASTVLVTLGALTFDGSTPVYAEFFAPVCGSTSAGIFHVSLFEDGVAIGEMGQVGAGSATSLAGARRFTPAAGSHTYSARAWITGAGTGTPTVNAGAGGAGALVPMFLRLVRDT